MKKIILIVLLLFTINVNASSIKDYSNGIDARITQKSIITKLDNNKESLIISSETGIYIKTDDEYRYIKTSLPPVSVVVSEDINSDNVKDIVYALNSTNGNYNLIAISGKDLSVIWSSNITKKTFNFEKVFNKPNIIIDKIESLDKKIGVISGYSLYVIDSKTGNLSFKYVDKDNIWDITEVKDINNNLYNEIAISNQLGEVKLLDGKTGKTLWSKKILQDIKIPTKNPTTRNIWQVEFYKDNIVSIGEDGTLFLIDYKTGNIKDKLILDSFSNKDLEEYYLSNLTYGRKSLYPIYKGSEFYKNYEVFFKDDYILVSRFFNADNRSTNINKNNKVKVYKIKDFKVISDIEIENISLVNIEPLELNNKLYVPIEIKDNNLIINKYDYDTKKFEQEKVYVNNYLRGETKEKIYLQEFGKQVLLEQQNQTSLIYNKELKQIEKNNNSYSIATIIKSNNNELVVSYKSNDIIHKIEYYNNLNNDKPTWEYNIPNNFLNNGLYSIYMDQDYNKDGKADITALMNKVDNKNRVISTYFLIFNSKDGKVINFKNIHTGSYMESGKRIDMYLTGSNLIPIKDINNDGISDLILDNTIINGSNISILGAFDISVNTTSSKILTLGDLNNDSIKDIIVIESNQATIYQSKIGKNSISYIKTNKVIKYPKDVLNEEQALLIPDLNNDGIKEVVINDRDNNKKQVFKIYSGKDLKYMFTITDVAPYEGGYTYSFFNDDLDGDGYNDFYLIKMNSIYVVLSGKTGKALKTINLHPENNNFIDSKDMLKENRGITPFNYNEIERSMVIGIDINKDSKRELFILKEEYFPKPKITVLTYNINDKSNKSIRNLDIYYEQNNYGRNDIYSEASYMKSIIEVVNGNGLYLIKPPGVNNIVVYDAINNKTLSEITGNFYKAIKTSNDNIFGVTLGNNPIYINFENDFKVINVKDKSKSKSPVKIELNKSSLDDLRVVKIYNKGNLLATKYTDTFDLDLKRGNYDLVFKSYDIWGKTQNYNLNITINKFNPYIVLIVILSILVILLIIYLSIGYKIKRKIRLRRIYE